MSGIIVCAPWDAVSRLLAAEKRVCECGAEVALAKVNAPKADAMGLVVICIPCLGKRVEVDSQTVIGGLANGELFTDLAQGFRAAAAARDRN